MRFVVEELEQALTEADRHNAALEAEIATLKAERDRHANFWAEKGEARGIERAKKVIADYGQEGDQLSKEYACEMADELVARLNALKDTPNG